MMRCYKGNKYNVQDFHCDAKGTALILGWGINKALSAQYGVTRSRIMEAVELWLAASM